jgi:hypothetical protein
MLSARRVGTTHAGMQTPSMTIPQPMIIASPWSVRSLSEPESVYLISRRVMCLDRDAKCRQ